MDLNRLFVCFFRGEGGGGVRRGGGGRRGESETIQGAWGMLYRNPDL